jgi:hypothetical protein
MRVIKNSITPDLAQYCLEEIKRLQNVPIWQSSTVFWSEGIRKGITGSCIVTSTCDNIRNQILNQVGQCLPNTASDITTMFYIWQHNSGISKHTDPGYTFAATIYLNPYWDVDWGGNFLYYDNEIDWENNDKSYMSDHQNWKVVIPESGTMVLNNDQTLHMVTPLSPLSPELRYTIQIWGHT